MNLQNLSILRWIQQNNIKTEDGTPYDMVKYRFMLEPLRELAKLSKDIVVYKAAQIGFSTAAILASFWIAKNKAIDMIYTLPTANDVKDFAGGKINRIIAQNQVLGQWVKDRDTVEQKSVGNNIIYYRGTFTQKAAMMVSSDLNAYDEIDASDQRVVEQYSTRLQASDLKREWFFSHPSVEGNGVSKKWPLSDQRHWFITCENCGQEQYMSWPESFDMERQIYICKACNAGISNKMRQNGRWVAKYKNKEMIGFWIPLFICPWVSAKDIIKYHNEKSEEYFQNKVIGLPYVGSGNKLTQAVLVKSLKDEFIDYEAEDVVIGVDTGLGIHLVAGNNQGLFYHSSTEDYTDFEKLMRRFPKAIAVFDAQGDLQKPRELQEKYGTRMYLCYYQEDRKTKELIKWGGKDEEGIVKVDRNRMIQHIVDEFYSQRISLYGKEIDWLPYFQHWANIYRTEEENKLGIMVRRWKRSGHDHLVHATCYWRTGVERFGREKGGIIDLGVPSFPTAPTINPDGTMPAIKPRRI